MIKLKGSNISDIMPQSLSSQPEVQAFGYALSRQVQKLCQYSDEAKIYAEIDNITNDKVLDILAATMRTPNYKTSFPIHTKKAMIKDTFLYRLHLGTKDAVERFINDAFGGGWIEEWFDYSVNNPYPKLPHHFTVFTYTYITEEMLQSFYKEIERIKRSSSWMDGVIQVVERTFRNSIYLFGTGFLDEGVSAYPASNSPRTEKGAEVYSVSANLDQTHTRLARQN